MGTLYVDTLEPEGATTSLAVGESGQNMVIGGNTMKFNNSDIAPKAVSAAPLFSAAFSNPED